MMHTRYTEIPLSWGWRIKKAGYTQKEFANELGISEVTLSFASRGKRIPSLSIFEMVESKLRDLNKEKGSNKDENRNIQGQIL